MNISGYINQIILTILLIFAAFLGAQVRNLYRKYVNTEIKQAVCKTAVLFVEQVYKDIHGPEKLAMAMARASAILKEYGIEISDVELTAMLEAAVREFINAFEHDETPGKHEEGQAPAAAEPARILDPETGGTATLEEIMEDLKSEE